MPGSPAPLRQRPHCFERLDNRTGARRMRRFTSAFAAIFFFFLFTGISFGQATTGSILGTAHDATGAVVPGAVISVTDTGKGTTMTAKTDADGSYNVPFLIPGMYNVAIEAAGFRRSDQRHRSGYRPEGAGGLCAAARWSERDGKRNVRGADDQPRQRRSGQCGG